MLKIIRGKCECDNYISSPGVFFNNTFEDEWIMDPLTVQMVKDIDGSDVRGPLGIYSPYLGSIPTERLSGGVKALILMAHDREHIFNASACGDNCTKWILKIAEMLEERGEDLIIRLGHRMSFMDTSVQIEYIGGAGVGSSDAVGTTDTLNIEEIEAPLVDTVDMADMADTETVKIEVSNNKVVYDLKLCDKITVLRGDSATGKTVLIELIDEFSNYGAASGIKMKCEKRCCVLDSRNWELMMRERDGSVFFIDAGYDFVKSPEFAESVGRSNGYFVIVCREDLPHLGVDGDEDGSKDGICGICGLELVEGSRGRTHNRMYKIKSRNG